jgi:hypothetical protein
MESEKKLDSFDINVEGVVDAKSVDLSNAKEQVQQSVPEITKDEILKIPDDDIISMHWEEYNSRHDGHRIPEYQDNK